MKTKTNLAMLLIAVVGLLLTGCGEVLNEYYISNHSDTAVTITMTTIQPDRAIILAGDLIETLESNARAEMVRGMLRPLSVEEINGAVQFEIPPATTVYLGASSGGNDLFSELIVVKGEETIPMTDSNYDDYFTLHDNFVGPIVHVYDIE